MVVSRDCNKKLRPQLHYILPNKLGTYLNNQFPLPDQTKILTSNDNIAGNGRIKVY